MIETNNPRQPFRGAIRILYQPAFMTMTAHTLNLITFLSLSVAAQVSTPPDSNSVPHTSSQLPPGSSLSVPNEQRIERAKALIKSKGEEWAKGTFQDIASLTFSTNLSQKIARGGLELSIAKREKLTTELTDFFRAFHAGSFDAYLQFRTNGLKHELTFSRLAEGVIADRSKKGVAFPQEPYARARIYWETLNPTNRQGERPKILSVDLDTMRITIRSATEPRSHAGERALKILPTMAATSRCEIISFSETPEGLLTRNGYFTLAMAEAIVRYNTADLPGYVILTFYWSPADRQWIPWELVRDAASRFNVIF